MTETISAFVANVHGRMWHVRDARQSPETEDMPDLLILVPGGLAVIELKSQDRATTPGQLEVKWLMSTVTSALTAFVRPEPLDGEWSFDDLLQALKTMHDAYCDRQGPIPARPEVLSD